MVPFQAATMWYVSYRYPANNDEFGRFSFDICWSICVGLAQSKMHWYYTMDEVRARVKARLGLPDASEETSGLSDTIEDE